MANHDGNLWWWRLWWPERCLQQRLLYLFQIRHPEALLSPCNQCRAYGILKDFVDAKICEDTGLVVAHAQLLCHSPCLVRHDQVTFQGSPYKRSLFPKVGQIVLIAIHVSQVVLAPDKHDGYIWTKATYFWIPHQFAIAERDRTCYGETQQHDIRSIRMKRIIKQCKIGLIMRLTCRRQIDDPCHDHRMCPTGVTRH